MQIKVYTQKPKYGKHKRFNLFKTTGIKFAVVTALPIRTKILFHCCLDIDECFIGSHNCSENAECYNIDGSFICRCKPGYKSLVVEKTGFVDQCMGK